MKKGFVKDFEHLLQRIVSTGAYLQERAFVAVNRATTVRSWCFGLFIVEYEQNGQDRAQYGEQLIERVSTSLADRGMKGVSATALKLCRQFYLTYPEIGQTLSDQFDIPLRTAISDAAFKLKPSIRQTLSDELAVPDRQLENHRKRLIATLSFSHFVEIMQLDEPLKRLFYEVECINGNWSVRELKRQIGSLLYERTGLSRDKETLLRLVKEHATQLAPQHVIRDPYVFEFLGLSPQDVLLEKGLEDALLDHLQSFLLELGKGFCFESRQKRIIVDNEHFFVDLVFYHRLLKCHVLIELKAEKFHHSHVGQLNFYLNYFRKYEMVEGDNPPVGILLCTARDAEHVEFATAGLDNQVFISKYRLALPTEEELKVFIQKELQEGT
jgi:predicted nuclease of restriction endonuclease-like (RecB) superfamily